MGIGKRLKSILDEKKITVTKLSEDTKIPATTLYSLIKRDSEKENVDTLKKIAEILGVPFGDLVGWPKATASFTTYSDIRDKLLDKFDQLNETGQEKAVERVEELTEVPKYKK